VDVYKSIANIEDLVETETSAGDVDKSKPHADVFTAFQRAFSSSPRMKLIVGGDTPYDAQATGKLAGAGRMLCAVS
jgi:FMN phosphatase YigB (HAD superfamily)